MDVASYSAAPLPFLRKSISDIRYRPSENCYRRTYLEHMAVLMTSHYDYNGCGTPPPPPSPPPNSPK
ncbi:hypothetical protein GJ744_003741 [Endocarpon pusillum]|uniref:Uncharacterized protein n=1 Tax=Endocarpon pusillum TaxID=364733 RepID=A0A8H7A9I8_9EURO|nr:hypothetical protein GJ744_003741 [Endocarpon pusillum]